MKHHRTVDSSNVHELEYDDVSHDLVVTFKGGAKYSYAGVPLEAYEGLISAPSIGKRLAQYIKNDYPATRLRPG